MYFFFNYHNMQINRIREKKTLQHKDAHMEVSETATIQQESSESMDFSLTPDSKSLKTAETKPMHADNLKPQYSYKWVDSWSWIHINTWLSFITL